MIFFSIRRVLSKASKKIQKLGRSNLILSYSPALTCCTSPESATLGTEIIISHSLNSLIILSKSCLSYSWSGFTALETLKQLRSCLFFSLSIFIFPAFFSLSSRYYLKLDCHPKAYSVAIYHSSLYLRYYLHFKFYFSNARSSAQSIFNRYCRTPT